MAKVRSHFEGLNGVNRPATNTNTDKTRNKLPTTDRKNINQRTLLKQSRHHIRFHCNQMINLRGMNRRTVACVQTSPLRQEKSIFPEGGGTSVHRLKNCYPCIEFKLC